MTVFVDEQMELTDERYTGCFYRQWSVCVPNLVIEAGLFFIIIVGVKEA